MESFVYEVLTRNGKGKKRKRKQGKGDKPKKKKKDKDKKDEMHPYFDYILSPQRLIPGFNSHFIEYQIIYEYLKCEVTPWKYPKSSKDKVELEPLPTEFLPPIKKSPIMYPIHLENGEITYIQRVCGYREIYKKRQWIEYLKNMEDGGMFCQVPDDQFGKVECDNREDALIEKQFQHVAPGGGKKNKKSLKDDDHTGSKDKPRKLDRDDRHRVSNYDNVQTRQDRRRHQSSDSSEEEDPRLRDLYEARHHRFIDDRKRPRPSDDYDHRPRRSNEDHDLRRRSSSVDYDYRYKRSRDDYDHRRRRSTDDYYHRRHRSRDDSDERHRRAGDDYKQEYRRSQYQDEHDQRHRRSYENYGHRRSNFYDHSEDRYRQSYDNHNQRHRRRSDDNYDNQHRRSGDNNIDGKYHQSNNNQSHGHRESNANYANRHRRRSDTYDISHRLSNDDHDHRHSRRSDNYSRRHRESSVHQLRERHKSTDNNDHKHQFRSSDNHENRHKNEHRHSHEHRHHRSSGNPDEHKHRHSKDNHEKVQQKFHDNHEKVQQKSHDNHEKVQQKFHDNHEKVQQKSHDNHEKVQQKSHDNHEKVQQKSHDNHEKVQQKSHDYHEKVQQKSHDNHEKVQQKSHDNHETVQQKSHDNQDQKHRKSKDNDQDKTRHEYKSTRRESDGKDRRHSEHHQQSSKNEKETTDNTTDKLKSLKQEAIKKEKSSGKVILKALPPLPPEATTKKLKRITGELDRKAHINREKSEFCQKQTNAKSDSIPLQNIPKRQADRTIENISPQKSQKNTIQETKPNEIESTVQRTSQEKAETQQKASLEKNLPVIQSPEKVQASADQKKNSNQTNIVGNQQDSPTIAVTGQKRKSSKKDFEVIHIEDLEGLTAENVEKSIGSTNILAKYEHDSKDLLKKEEEINQKLKNWLDKGNTTRLQVEGDANPKMSDPIEKAPGEPLQPLQEGAKEPTILEEQTVLKIANYFSTAPQIVYAATTGATKSRGLFKETIASKAKTRSKVNPEKKTNTLKSKTTSQPAKKGAAASSKNSKLPKSKTDTDLVKKKRQPIMVSKSKALSEPPDFDITDFESYYRFVHGTDLLEKPERDTEWIQLSDTDEEVEKNRIQSFEKPLPPWMLEGISYESQNLVKLLGIYYYSCKYMGRSFYVNVPNFVKGHMDFITTRTHMIPFFISSFILWASFVLMCQSWGSIKSDNTKNDEAVLIEKLELEKYHIALTFVFVNLGLAAVWSVLVILRDGQLITHYMNCWCAALAEMETTGAVDIQRITIYNLASYGIVTLLLIICFAFDYPATVRGTSGLVSMLILRDGIANIRLLGNHTLLFFQIFGLIFILYVLFCVRMVYTFLQLVSLIIKNTSEMWNLKFALAFKQLAMKNRGQMFRLSLNLPTAKFFTHHRVITALLKMYGQNFGLIISFYIVLQMGVVTATLVYLYNFKAGNVADYNGTDHVIYDFIEKEETKLSDGNITTITTLQNLTIPYFHRPSEEIGTALFVLGQVAFDFAFTTEVISVAGQSYFDGFEYVRRTNLILAQTSHQRRVIQSLLWSFSSTDANYLSANKYFPVGRPAVAGAVGTVVFFFSLIIQLQSVNEITPITFERCADAKGKQIGDRCDATDTSSQTDNLNLNATWIFYVFFEHCVESEEKLYFKSHIDLDYTLDRNDTTLANFDYGFPICRLEIKQEKFDTFTPNPFYRYLVKGTLKKIFFEAESYLIGWKGNRGMPFQPKLSNDTIANRDHQRCSFEPDKKHDRTYPPPNVQPCDLSYERDRHETCPHCTWYEFFRDCFTACYSPIFKQYFVIPALLVAKNLSSSNYADHYVGQHTYIKNKTETDPNWDCGINPYAREDDTVSLYDCFGTEVLKKDIDQCGFYDLMYPNRSTTNRRKTTWSPLKKLTDFLSDSAESKLALTKYVMDPTILADITNSSSADHKCVSDRFVGRNRCKYAKHAVYCGLSGLPGLTTPGYWHDKRCRDYAWMKPTKSGFCKSVVFRTDSNAEKAAAGTKFNDYKEFSVDDNEWEKAEREQWDREFPKNVLPCDILPSLTADLQKFLYYKFACPDSTGSFINEVFYRPYYRTPSGGLRQIPFDYAFDGYHKNPRKIDPTTVTMCQVGQMFYPYPNLPYTFTFNASGRIETHTVDEYLGCHGHLLRSGPNPAPTRPCIPGSPLLSNRNCEVEYTTRYFFPEDCSHPNVDTSDKVRYKLDWGYGTCRVDWDGPNRLPTSPFRQITPEWHRRYLERWDTWKKDAQVYDITKQNTTHPNEPFCGELSTLGQKVPLSYNPPTAIDLNLCSWEPAYRDCYRPCVSQSNFLNRIIFVPVWINAKTKKPFTDPKLYGIDCAFDIFLIEPEEKAIRCDEGSFERVKPDPSNNDISIFPDDQKDDCGWVNIPTFTQTNPLPPARPLLTVPVTIMKFDANGVQRPHRLECYNTRVAQDRCNNDIINSHCHILKEWKVEHGKFVPAYRFGDNTTNGCFLGGNKKPDDEGFCGPDDIFYPEKLVSDNDNDVLTKDEYEKIKFILDKEYSVPNPCEVDPDLVELQKSKIKVRRFLQFHCMSRNGILLKSLHRPMYRTSKNTLRFVPLDSLKSHLASVNCRDALEYRPRNYIVTLPDNTQETVTEHLGCQKGYLLYRIGPSWDPTTICHSDVLSFYCEIEKLEKVHFLPFDCANGQTINSLSKNSVDAYGICELTLPKEKLPNNANTLYPARLISDAMYKEIIARWQMTDDDAEVEYNRKSTEMGYHPCHSEIDNGNYTTFCEWTDHLKHCYRPCNSNIMRRHIIVPIQVYEDTKGHYKLFRRYNNEDCATQPFFTKIDIPVLPVKSFNVDDTFGCRHNIAFGPPDACGWLSISEYVLENQGTPLERLEYTFPITQTLSRPILGFDESTGYLINKMIMAWMRNDVENERTALREIRRRCGAVQFPHGPWVEAFTYGEHCFKFAYRRPDDFGFCSIPYPLQELNRRENLGNGYELSATDLDPPVISSTDYNRKEIVWGLNTRWYTTGQGPCQSMGYLHDRPLHRPLPIKFRLYFLFPCFDDNPSANNKVTGWNNRIYNAIRAGALVFYQDDIIPELRRQQYGASQTACISLPYPPFLNLNGIQLTRYHGCFGEEIKSTVVVQSVCFQVDLYLNGRCEQTWK